MLMFHVTHIGYLPSIINRGLAPGMAQRAKRVWGVSTASALAWAIAHVQDCHDWPVHSLAITTWAAKRDEWCQAGRRGVWWTPNPVGNERLRSVRRLVSTGISGGLLLAQ